MFSMSKMVSCSYHYQGVQTSREVGFVKDFFLFRFEKLKFGWVFKLGKVDF